MTISQPASAGREQPRISRAKQIAVLQLVQVPPRPNGGAAAVVLAAGGGGALGGVLLLLSQAGSRAGGWLADGPGALVAGLLAWLGLWLTLHMALRRRSLDLRQALLLAGALGALGLVAGALALIIGFSAK